MRATYHRKQTITREELVAPRQTFWRDTAGQRRSAVLIPSQPQLTPDAGFCLYPGLQAGARIYRRPDKRSQWATGNFFWRE
ncbi:hypothetical protein KCP71_05210 [Salmonella enterica subsp. enterica]|nr:hypothetical protein KCP71_05210 [Salmonella enterica subsp. enterica]